MKNETGGPAFPHEKHGPNLSTWIEPGMDLRDYFAAKALASLLIIDGTHNASFNIRARESYELADAMLKAREQK